jgi:DNA-binding NarL/FixJ family response regulator/tetratricopeptide (TPR) repeat protein
VFGREPECARIEQLLDRAPAGPVGIAIEGTPGIGKTTVWRHALDSARARGYRVLEATPSEPDAALAFSGLGDLFDGLGDELFGCLPEPQRHALRGALFLSAPSEAADDLDALPRAVLSVLRALAVEATVVVAIDDEQWLDRASARVLAFALRRVRRERICLLLSWRTDSDGALRPEMRRSFAPGVDVIALSPLDLAAISRLLTDTVARKLPRRALQRVHEISGGNPLYALALGAELARGNGSLGDWRELPIPGSLGDAIAQRLERVRTGVEAPLFAVAALADPTVGVLDAALGEFDAADLHDAVDAGVIEVTQERLRFTHPLLASVHYASVPAQERHELHLRLAGAVADPEERALHLALGTREPDEDVAGELERAASLAARRGAPEAAAELLEHAIRLTPVDHDQARWTRTVTAAERHLVGGDFAAARALGEQLLLEQPDGRSSARARLVLAIVRKDDFEFAVSMLQQALIDAGEDDRLTTEIELVLSDWCSNLCDFAGVVSHAEAAVASAERLGEPGSLATALGMLGGALFNAGQPLPHDLFKRAIELEHQAGETVATLYLPSTIYGGALPAVDLDAARPLMEGAVARARRRGEEGNTLQALLVRLQMVEWYAGNVTASDRYLAEAAEAARYQLDYEIDSWIALQQGEVAAVRGELEQARVKADEALALATRNRDRQIQRDAEAFIADIELWSGQPDAAHERLQPWRARMIADGPWVLWPMLLPLWSSDVEALIALGRLDEAQLVVDDLLQRAGASQSRHAAAIAKRCEGLLLGARGELASAIDVLDLALAEHARQRLPLQLGRTLLEKGSLERRAKRKTAAKHTLEQALQILEPLGAALWAARARDELGRIGLRRAVVTEGLTPAQERVAELAAGGATNREIAQTLYMSERTVEAHLTKIYRELEIRSRAQLAAALSATASTDNGDP